MFDTDPSAYLPHRAPFLFLDRVLAREAGASATGEFLVPVGAGQFPPVLLLESMAQLTGVAAGQRPGEGGVLAAVGKAELPVRVHPGALLTVQSKVVRSFGNLVVAQAEVRHAETVVATATLTLAIGDAPSHGA